jgi:hypothetical protein
LPAIQREGPHRPVRGISGTAPFTRTVIVRSNNSISAPSPQTFGPENRTYAFRRWSDGGAQTHNITAPTAATTYQACFRFSCLFSWEKRVRPVMTTSVPVGTGGFGHGVRGSRDRQILALPLDSQQITAEAGTPVQPVIPARAISASRLPPSPPHIVPAVPASAAPRSL